MTVPREEWKEREKARARRRRVDKFIMWEAMDMEIMNFEVIKICRRKRYVVVIVVVVSVFS